MGLDTAPPAAMTPTDGRAFRDVLSHYPTGVCAITTTDDQGGPIVMVVGTFTSVSLDPPLIGFLPAKSSSTWPVLRQSGRFCANILSAAQAGLCKQLSSKDGDRFAGVTWQLSAGGNPILDGTVGWFDCAIHDISDAGDHDFVLGRVREMAVTSGTAPLLFHRGQFGSVA